MLAGKKKCPTVCSASSSFSSAAMALLNAALYAPSAASAPRLLSLSATPCAACHSHHSVTATP